MATDRRREAVAAVLLVVLAVVLYRAWDAMRVGSAGSPSAGPAPASNGRGRRQGESTRGAAGERTAPDVHIRALDEERPKPVSNARNLFRFKPKPPPPPPPSLAGPVARPAPSAPAGPAPPPPIALKFIGIVEAPSQQKRIAALVDATGHVFQGGEGDVIAGQYRVLKIGVESIEMAYLDGRGRQTIRLSGS
jgi:hypothetical protein